LQTGLFNIGLHCDKNLVNTASSIDSEIFRQAGNDEKHDPNNALTARDIGSGLLPHSTFRTG
jgi:hypothetical protein